jgi:hypothetical protein
MLHWEHGLLLCKVVSTESDVQVQIKLRVRGKPYSLTVTPAGFKLVPEGKRKGIEMPWSDFVSDDAVLYSELQASIRRILRDE